MSMNTDCSSWIEQTIPSAGIKILQLADKFGGIFPFHVVADDFEKAVNEGTAEQMYQLWLRTAGGKHIISRAFNILKCIFLIQ